VAVAVEGQGKALALEDPLEQEEIPLSVLLLPKEGIRDRSRGVIYGPHQG